MATPVGAKNHAERVQDVIAEYCRKHPGRFRSKDVAAWAIREGKMDVPRMDRVNLLARTISQANRVEYYTDPQGRRVRKKHAIRSTEIIDGEEKQLIFWDDIETATPKHMQIAFQQRRHGILYDCHQHKTDVDSYNDNNKAGAQLLFVYDFSEDLAELAHSTEYPEEKPEDEEE